MPDSPCLANVRALYDAIMAKSTGRQVQSMGHRGRDMSYSEMDVKDMISLYRQLWQQCPDAQVQLPDLKPLDAVTGTRGRPAQFLGRPWA